MKVYCYLSDEWACGHYRQVFPAQCIDVPGMEIELISADMRKVQLDIDGRTGQLRSEGFPRDADVVMLQRPSNMALVQAVVALQVRGVAVVVDVDDDLAHINPSNPAWMSMHPRTTIEKGLPVMHSWANIAYACRNATLVTVTTPRLARVYGAHGRVRVLPNCVPASFLDIPHRETNEIGWAGSIHSHPGDLEVVGSSVARLVRDGARFTQVGDPTGVAQALGLPYDHLATGTLPFADWHAAVAQRIGIGIVPLADTRFNEAKSFLKGLEYAACGVPFVASDVPSYRVLHDEGAGLLARKPNHWYGQLRELIDNEDARVSLAEAGREVARRWTYETNAWKWAEAWHDSVAMLDKNRSRFVDHRPSQSIQRRKPAKKGRRARIEGRR